MSTSTDSDLESLLGDHDPEDCAHIIRRSGSLSAAALRDAAAEAGIEVQALCGYKWIPSGTAPDSMPVCAACVRIWSPLVDPSR